ncbi:hypothetical protein BDW02DRAFT_36521 [Decorospora gaudefroyi]|uniref:MARVEL domain-containing protein n=1 Tax=Decorospora gaudefroyi TaxID=184978 RepID=A0A6A5K3Q3_9PLEO|nr:hypothetical protein BDW02DRAFT_36521 [Decorospora gaudefroyi]
MVSPIINFALRGLQALFAIVVLGLSVTLIRGHHWGSLPASLGFAAFVGGITFLAALVGLAAGWFEILGGIVGLVVDGVVALINIACGVLFAIKLGGVDCNNVDDLDNVKKLVNNEWFNGGCRKLGDGEKYCWTNVHYGGNDDGKKLADVYSGHCKEAQADTVFMFLTAVVLLVCGVMVWLRMKNGH